MKQALMRDLPRWRTEIAEQMKTTPVPEALAQEFQLFQQMQLISTQDFSHQLPHIMSQLKNLPSPFLEEASKLLLHNEAEQLSNAQHTLFLQRWRLSLTLQNAHAQRNPS